MITRTTSVEEIPAIEHDEAMRLAADEYERVLALVDELHDDDWSRQTDCGEWDVRAMLGHMLGHLELQADAEERMRLVSAAAGLAKQSGRLRLDEMTALQVREHAHLTPHELGQALHDETPPGLAARNAMTAEQRAVTHNTELPGEGPWTLGYLFDIIHTRDPWMHRIDISRAVGRDVVLSADHDGRIVADVVADWASRHGQPFTLTLTGPAGGCYTAGDGGPDLELDAVEFCRILCGRGQGTGLLATGAPF